MRCMSFASLAAVLLVAHLITAPLALAQNQVWTWLDKTGAPKKLVPCGGCSGAKCRHKLSGYSQDSKWSGFIKVAKNKWKKVTSRRAGGALLHLEYGGSIRTWETKVLFSYSSKCLCACPNKSHANCGGQYPHPWWVNLSLKETIPNISHFNRLRPDFWWQVLATPKKFVKHMRVKVKLSMAPCTCCKLPPGKKAPKVPPKKKTGKAPPKKAAPKKKKTVLLLPHWPGKDGVLSTFIPSGENYGNIGDLAITNTTDQPVTVTVPPGLLLDSSDAGVQDLYVADVPTRTPYAGAKEINKPITIGAGQTYTIREVPGFCPDFELKPPDKGIADIYTTRPPDEKAKALLATIQAVKEFDVSKIKLEVFEKDQTREMLAQGALWLVDSKVDEVEGNDVSNEKLADRYWEAFESSGGPALAKMPPKQREESEKLVKEDLKKIVAATSFIAKKRQRG